MTNGQKGQNTHSEVAIGDGSRSMRRGSFSGGAYKVLSAVRVPATVASGVVAALLKVDTGKLSPSHPVLGDAVLWTQQNAWLLLIALAIFIGLSPLASSRLEARWVLNVVHQLLDEMWDYAFASEADAPYHKHRVTLFRYFRWHLCPRKLGIPVEMDGNPWGVIVIDSASDEIRRGPSLNIYRLIARILAKLLRRI